MQTYNLQTRVLLTLQDLSVQLALTESVRWSWVYYAYRLIKTKTILANSDKGVPIETNVEDETADKKPL